MKHLQGKMKYILQGKLKIKLSIYEVEEEKKTRNKIKKKNKRNDLTIDIL